MSYASKVLTHRALRRRHFAGLIVLATILVWSGVWAFAAMQFNKTIRTMVKDAKERGLLVSYEEQSTGGNPFTVNIVMHNFALATQSGANLKAGRATFYMNLWDWASVAAKLRDGVSGQLMDLPFTADSLKFGFAYPERAPLNYRSPGLSVWMQPFDMKLTTDTPLPFGNTIAEGLFSLRIMGPVPDFSKKESVAAWNDASGVFEFDRFYVVWGPVTVNANGTVGLSPSLQPEGAFSGRIEGLDQGIDALARQGAITKRQEALVRNSINVLSRPSGLTGNSTPIVPISIQGGNLYLGPVRLMDLPDLKWDEPKN